MRPMDMQRKDMGPMDMGPMDMEPMDMGPMEEEPRICDYEDSAYRTDFWEGQGREYEDLAERIALRYLLPPAGRRVIDIGAGFGRLCEFYNRFEQAILLDYSSSLLRQAQAQLG